MTQHYKWWDTIFLDYHSIPLGLWPVMKNNPDDIGDDSSLNNPDLQINKDDTSSSDSDVSEFVTRMNVPLNVHDWTVNERNNKIHSTKCI